MKKLIIGFTIVLLMCSTKGIARGWENGNSWQRAEEDNNWQGHDNETSGRDFKGNSGAVIRQEPGKERRYCSGKQEKELLELLQKLENPPSGWKDRIGGSEVRRKVRIAYQLRRFDDCRAEDALRKLIKEDECEIFGDGNILCVRWIAKESLQKIESNKDLKKLTPETPIDELKKIIKKYTKHPYKNNYAIQEIKKFLYEQASSNPEVYVPLMVECFPGDPRTLVVLRRYPKMINMCINKCLMSKEPSHVWWGINLARELERPEFLDLVHDVAFRGKGNMDYTNSEEVDAIRFMAIGYYRDFEQKSLQYYRDILFGERSQYSEYIISGIRDMKNPEIRKLLKEYMTYLDKKNSGNNAKIMDYLRKKLLQAGKQP
ncbi:MAG TPA: hypothetical protein ENK09_08695 [Nitrospirae bacterium]|nr:hypothetical protein [Nitrospirota bacterium]